MSPLKAAAEGMRRVSRAPAILFGMWALTLALPAMLAPHPGASLAADPAIGLLDSLSAFVGVTPRPVVIAGPAAVYIVLWIFMAGGIIDRYARDRATRAFGFFGSAGAFFFRFLRLAALQGIAYGVLFLLLHPWLFETIYPRLTREITVERTAFLIRVGLDLAFAILVAACAMIFDYAKVRAVVEDRRSMISALTAAIGFIRRNAGGAAVLFLVNLAMLAIAPGVYALIAPGARHAGPTPWLGVVIGQAYVVARLWITLTFWASETALFQSRLGHAGYVVRAPARWPDSPAVDAI
jgi:hypothetical protein